jgi:type II secretory pathway pseudopilin PulG
MIRRSNAGFTLVEALIAVLILAGTIGGVLLMYVTSMASSELAWDTTVATSHAEHVLEEMQARESAAEITSVNWAEWARGEGLTSLPEERVDAAFSDADTTPLGIKVTVNWKRKLRDHRVSFDTELAK